MNKFSLRFLRAAGAEMQLDSTTGQMSFSSAKLEKPISADQIHGPAEREISHIEARMGEGGKGWIVERLRDRAEFVETLTAEIEQITPKSRNVLGVAQTTMELARIFRQEGRRMSNEGYAPARRHELETVHVNDDARAAQVVVPLKRAM